MKKTLNDHLKALPNERRQKVEARAKEILVEEMSLQELRKALEHSQKKLAEKLQVNQGEISKIEHRTDMYVSTLRDYIEAMGGTLEITASFPNSPPIKINQFETEESREPMKV
jgi:transcriptional regulator with XRE-family HTH domain